MIISGGSRRNWRFFAKHLMRTDENERVKVAEVRGLAGETPLEALREMDALASGSRSKDFFYHANINPREGETLSPAQWEQAVDTLEKNLGLEGQSRLVVEHEKNGRTHRHVIWSRINPDTLTAIPDSHNFAKHAATSRELEREFALAPVKNVLAEPEGPRPERRPKNWETFRGHASGIDPQQVKAEVSELWRQTDSGKSFRTALAKRGYVLCQGDRRDFVIVDRAGHEHSVGRRLDGVKAAEIRKRLGDLDRDTLPKVTRGRQERRGDKESVAAAVSMGADKKRVQAAINAMRAGRVAPHDLHEELPQREARESYENTAQRRPDKGRVNWQERARQRERDVEPQR